MLSTVLKVMAEIYPQTTAQATMIATVALWGAGSILAWLAS